MHTQVPLIVSLLLAPLPSLGTGPAGAPPSPTKPAASPAPVVRKPTYPPARKFDLHLRGCMLHADGDDVIDFVGVSPQRDAVVAWSGRDGTEIQRIALDAITAFVCAEPGHVITQHPDGTLSLVVPKTGKVARTDPVRGELASAESGNNCLDVSVLGEAKPIPSSAKVDFDGKQKPRCNPRRSVPNWVTVQYPRSARWIEGVCLWVRSSDAFEAEPRLVANRARRRGRSCGSEPSRNELWTMALPDVPPFDIRVQAAASPDAITLAVSPADPIELLTVERLTGTPRHRIPVSVWPWLLRAEDGLIFVATQRLEVYDAKTGVALWSLR